MVLGPPRNTDGHDRDTLHTVEEVPETRHPPTSGSGTTTPQKFFRGPGGTVCSSLGDTHWSPGPNPSHHPTPLLQSPLRTPWTLP